jgi:hypothetical protein
MKSLYETYRVKPEEVDLATRFVDSAGDVLYVVRSRTDPHKEYIVHFDRQHNALSCTCPAMNPPTDEQGFFKWSPTGCWHTRAAICAATIYANLVRGKAEEEATQLRIAFADLAPYEYSEAEIDAAIERNRPCGFSLF